MSSWRILSFKHWCREYQNDVSSQVAELSESTPCPLGEAFLRLHVGSWTLPELCIREDRGQTHDEANGPILKAGWFLKASFKSLVALPRSKTSYIFIYIIHIYICIFTDLYKYNDLLSYYHIGS